MGSPKSIKFVDEYIWALPDEQLTELKGGGFGHKVFSEEEFVYKLEGGGSVTIVFHSGRAPKGLSAAGFGIRIKTCSKSKVNGQMSVMVDELEWFRNGRNLNSLKEGSST